jgi:hypothetical protein
VITTAAAPVQAEGTVAGRPFHFHARRDEWIFAVAEADGVDPAGLEASEVGRGWVETGRFPERGAGSYLSIAAVDALIRVCAAAYVRAQAT